MSIVDYVRILRKNAVLLSVMITVGGLCAGAAFLLQPREYTSQTELFVSTVEAANPTRSRSPPPSSKNGCARMSTLRTHAKCSNRSFVSSAWTSLLWNWTTKSRLRRITGPFC